MQKQSFDQAMVIDSAQFLVPPAVVAAFYAACAKLLESTAKYLAGEIAERIFGRNQNADIAAMIAQAVEALAAYIDGRLTQQDIERAQNDINTVIREILEIDLMMDGENRRKLLAIANDRSANAVETLKSKNTLGLGPLLQAVTCRFVVIAAYKRFGGEPKYAAESGRAMLNTGEGAFARDTVNNLYEFWDSKIRGVSDVTHTQPVGDKWGWRFTDNGEQLSGVVSGKTWEEASIYPVSLRAQRIKGYAAKRDEIGANIVKPFNDIWKHWNALQAELEK